MKPLYDITPFTLLDYPDLPAAIFWFAGCNLQCSYCYNPEIVLGRGTITEERALAFLATRIGLLDGVVLSGGECTLYPHLLSFCRKIKEMGFKVKVDTNGMRPDVLKDLLDQHLIDTVALDYKTTQKHWDDLCGGGEEALFWDSFNHLQKSGIDFEVRTTVHTGLIDEATLLEMANKLQEAEYTGNYAIQSFVSGCETLKPIPPEDHAVSLDVLRSRLSIPIIHRIL